MMSTCVTIAYLLPAVAVTLRILSPSAREGASAGGQSLVKPVKLSTGRRAGPDASALDGQGMVRAAGRFP